MSARILIVDDHDVVRQGVRSIISRFRPEWEICGEASNGEQALKAVTGLTPDVVILDVTMPVMNGLEAASRIVKSVSRCRILVLTMHESDRLCADIRQVGAHGYLQKSQAGRDLIRAIESLLGGDTFFEAEVKEVKEKTKPDKNSNPGTSFFAGLCSIQIRRSTLRGSGASASFQERMWRQSRREQPCLQYPS